MLYHPPHERLFIASRDRRVAPDWTGKTIAGSQLFLLSLLRAPRHGNFRFSTFLRE
jgi:hypothetical protein